MEIFGAVTGNGNRVAALHSHGVFGIGADEVHVHDVASVTVEEAGVSQFLFQLMQRCGDRQDIVTVCVDQDLLILSFQMSNGVKGDLPKHVSGSCYDKLLRAAGLGQVFVHILKERLLLDRLEHIVIGPHTESVYAVFRRNGQKDDPDIAVFFADLGAGIDARKDRHDDIQKNQVIVLFGQHIQQRVAVAEGVDQQVLLPGGTPFFQKLADLLLIFDCIVTKRDSDHAVSSCSERLFFCDNGNVLDGIVAGLSALDKFRIGAFVDDPLQILFGFIVLVQLNICVSTIQQCRIQLAVFLDGGGVIRNGVGIVALIVQTVADIEAAVADTDVSVDTLLEIDDGVIVIL